MANQIIPDLRHCFTVDGLSKRVCIVCTDHDGSRLTGDDPPDLVIACDPNHLRDFDSDDFHVDAHGVVKNARSSLPGLLSDAEADVLYQKVVDWLHAHREAHAIAAHEINEKGS